VRNLLLALTITALFHGAALAHRVNVFAYVDGGEIVVECSYSKSKRVKRGAVEVQDAVTGETFLKGETDESGNFRFPVPEAARAAGNGLRILLRAGEGHQNDWTVEAQEFMAAPASAGARDAVSKTDSGKASVASSETEPAVVSRGDVEAVVNAALDAKLAPIKRALLEQNEGGPGMREIVGGIGWIFGLLGVAAYFKSRPRV
jgi:nickel transport protein